MMLSNEAGVVQLINYYEETRNSPPRMQLFEERFTGYAVEHGLLWIRTQDGASVAYPLERVNQIALDDRPGVETGGNGAPGGARA